jgi:hypothetical protein
LDAAGGYNVSAHVFLLQKNTFNRFVLLPLFMTFTLINVDCVFSQLVPPMRESDVGSDFKKTTNQ